MSRALDIDNVGKMIRRAFLPFSSLMADKLSGLISNMMRQSCAGSWRRLSSQPGWKILKVKQKGNPSIRGSASLVTLNWAAYAGHLKLVMHLLQDRQHLGIHKQEAARSTSMYPFSTPTEAAAWAGHAAIVKLQLAHDTLGGDLGKSVAAHLVAVRAAERGHLEVVHFLMIYRKSSSGMPSPWELRAPSYNL